MKLYIKWFVFVVSGICVIIFFIYFVKSPEVPTGQLKVGGMPDRKGTAVIEDNALDVEISSPKDNSKFDGEEPKSPTLILNDILAGNIKSYDYSELVQIIYSDSEHIKIPSSEFDAYILEKAYLLVYLGLLDENKSLDIYKSLLTDLGLEQFKNDIDAVNAFLDSSRDEVKACVVLRVLEGLAFINTDASKNILTSIRTNPIVYSEEENVFLNSIIEGGVKDALAISDAIEEIGHDEFLYLYNHGKETPIVFKYLQKNIPEDERIVIYDSLPAS